MSRIYIGVGVAASVCLAAVAAGEVNDFKQPSDVACLTPPARPDFGSPLGCGEGPQPHNRTVQVTALSTGGSIASVNAVVVFNAEHVRIVEHVGQLPPHGRLYLV